MWSRFSPPSNFVNVSTVWFMVCRWPQSQESDWVRPRLCKLARHVLWPVQKRFIKDHVLWGRSKPGCQIIGLVTIVWLTTEADDQSSFRCIIASNDICPLIYYIFRGVCRSMFMTVGGNRYMYTYTPSTIKKGANLFLRNFVTRRDRQNAHLYMCHLFLNLTVKTALKSIGFWWSYIEKQVGSFSFSPFWYRVSRYQKGKTNLDFTEARDSEWQWHQLCHMQFAPRSRQITMPAYHHSVFYRPDNIT